VCEALQRFGACIGLDGADLQLDTRRFDYVTADELAYLPATGCQVELHGHVHRYPNGNPRAFADDLQACDDAIVSAGLPLPRHYCYPSGSFDAAAAKVLERMGIRSATTCLSGLARKGASRYYLPRFLDGEDVHAIEFEAEMSGLLDLARRAFSRAELQSPVYVGSEETAVSNAGVMRLPAALSNSGLLQGADQGVGPVQALRQTEADRKQLSHRLCPQYMHVALESTMTQHVFTCRGGEHLEVGTPVAASASGRRFRASLRP
jgi:Polysaccharide deacetylase